MVRIGLADDLVGPPVTGVVGPIQIGLVLKVPPEDGRMLFQRADPVGQQPRVVVRKRLMVFAVDGPRPRVEQQETPIGQVAIQMRQQLRHRQETAMVLEHRGQPLAREVAGSRRRSAEHAVGQEGLAIVQQAAVGADAPFVLHRGQLHERLLVGERRSVGQLDGGAQQIPAFGEGWDGQSEPEFLACVGQGLVSQRLGFLSGTKRDVNREGSRGKFLRQVEPPDSLDRFKGFGRVDAVAVERGRHRDRQRHVPELHGELTAREHHVG